MHSLLCIVYISTSEDDLCLFPIFPPFFSVPCASGSRLWGYSWAKKFVLRTRAKESLPNDELRNESHSSAGESELVPRQRRNESKVRIYPHCTRYIISVSAILTNENDYALQQSRCKLDYWSKD
jgi:hypothetical protein